MTNGSPGAMGTTVPATTFADAFRRLAEIHRDRTVLRTLDDDGSLTWEALRARVDALAGGLAGLGVTRGDSIALMLNNRPEFHIADLAAVTLGATPFSIYQTLSPEQIEYVIADAGARVALVERALLAPLLAARRRLPALAHVIVVDGDGGAGTTALAEIEGSSPSFDAAATARAVAPDDLLTLIYTSGTTGPPKGVQITHRNLFSVMESLEGLLDFPPDSRVISWLPTAHIAERALNYYIPLLLGATITCCPNPREIATYLPKVRPTFFFAVPRIWEKLKAGLEAKLASLPAEQREKMEAALAAATEKVRLEQRGAPVPPTLTEAVARADAEAFAMIRGLIGLDQARAVVVGAAPTPRTVLEFFHALGLPLREGWGMSETTAVGTINPPEKVKLGTVGPPVPGVELKLAADGEVLIRGGNIMRGYRNQPEKTADTIDAEGWLATGDVGVIDEDGYLRIVDRKKELIINSAGKNMSPANIESTLKAASPLIGQACVIGDARPYNTALLVLDPEYAAAWAAQHGLAGRTLDELAREDTVRAAVEAAVRAANAHLSRVEQIKTFTLIAGDWSAGGDELTPTMKLKRKPIAEKYAREIEAMYRARPTAE